MTPTRLGLVRFVSGERRKLKLASRASRCVTELGVLDAKPTRVTG
jgi:hypothetical protein